MSHQIDLAPEYLSVLKEILDLHLLPEAKVWVFGSRVTGRTKKFSDIDLLVDTGEPISLEKMARLNLAFEESILPYKVDIVDIAAISDVLKKNIQEQLVSLRS